MPVDIQEIKSRLGDVNYKFNCVSSSSYECRSSFGDYNPCENDYCRCGVVNAVQVYFDSDNLPGVTFDSDVERLLLTRYLQKVGDRHLSSAAKDEYSDVSNDNFDWNASGGYYGEELDSVIASFGSYGWEQFFEACKKWNQCANDADRVRLYLEDENGYILPELYKCDFEFVFVSRKKIAYDSSVAKTKNMRKVLDYSFKMSRKNFDYKSLGLICRKDGDLYRVIDGYHRAIALDRVPGLKPNKKVGILVAK